MHKPKSLLGGLILLVAGVLFLLSNHDMLPPLGPLFHTWWPLLLIIAGLYSIVRSRGANITKQD